jgi:hypothetical protein
MCGNTRNFLYHRRTVFHPSGISPLQRAERIRALLEGKSFPVLFSLSAKEQYVVSRRPEAITPLAYQCCGTMPR